ncbi:MAG TPA: hypothetical protein VNV85_04325, partial [Puia sp.]|nr:hypothetical protein [Puia sp.]
MKTLSISLLLCLSGNQIYAQYGGYSNSGSTNYLGAGSSQGVFSDITYNDGSITSSASAIVYFLGSTPNTQHQLLSSLGTATATQIGNAILQNGTGGLFIDNASTGMEIVTNFNFNGQNGQVTTLRDASSVANNNMHIDANATISGSNVTNNVNGYVKKDGDAAGFTFPLADGTVYAPATVSALGIGNAIVAAYYNSSPN